ncbi:MAG: 30S ribosomal protein S17e [Candidatus Woesearchaeota archaeon]|jgi:small subunit ribosomal protein S17e|nr:30S ribosomal protein S17e [Candidatus Woesearchaeota archaeon]
MGRIKTKNIKRVTLNLIENHFNEFSEDVNKNKAVVEKYADVPSKKLRNTIAGYATRRFKARETL